MAEKLKKVKRKLNTIVGLACVHATFNNTILNITDLNGNTLAWSSSGTKGFKGSWYGIYGLNLNELLSEKTKFRK